MVYLLRKESIWEKLILEGKVVDKEFMKNVGSVLDLVLPTKI